MEVSERTMSCALIFIVIQVSAVIKWDLSKCQVDFGAYPSWESQNADSLASASFFHNKKKKLLYIVRQIMC